MDKKKFRGVFGEWFKYKRIKSGKTLIESGLSSGVSKGHMSEMERGLNGCTLLNAILLCESVDSSLIEFVEYFETVRGINNLKHGEE